MSRLSLLTLVLAVVTTSCGLTTEVEEDPTEETPAPSEVLVGDEDDEGIAAETTTTLPLDDEGDEDAGPLEIATLLPIESGTFEGSFWIKWRLDGPIPNPIDVHRTYQLNIESVEDDLFGLGWTVPIDEDPFASGFCFEDRPNCDDGTVALEVEVGPLGDELTFSVPQETFGNATGLQIRAFIQTFPAGADPVTEFVGDGAGVPMRFVEEDPC